MLKNLKDGSITLFFLVASAAVIQLGYLSLAENSRLKASHDRVDAVADAVYRTTDDSVKRIAKSFDQLQSGVNQNLWLITDPESGHLAKYMYVFGSEGKQIAAHLHTIDQSVQTLVSGDASIDENGDMSVRRGLLDLSESLTENSNRLATIQGKVAHDFLDCDSNDRCLSARLDAFSDKLSALQEKGLGVATQLDDGLPLYLDCSNGNPSCAYNLFQGTAKAMQGTSQDVHSYVHTFIAKRNTSGKIWDIVTGAFKGCSRFC